MSNSATQDWSKLASSARLRSWARIVSLYAFLSAVSAPVIIAYIGLVVMAFASRDPQVLWRAVTVTISAIAAAGFVLAFSRTRMRAIAGCTGIGIVVALALALLIGPDLHLRNFDFLHEPIRRGAPSFWRALGNSAMLAVSQTCVVTTVASLAGYFLSRFAFAGRRTMLALLLVVHAFPVMTLIIPLFLMLWWAGLLNSLIGVMFVLVALELPFAIFLMKGFFDAVPWETEMCALTDGATRRQAFLRVVLPQVSGGMAAVAVFAFIRGWEEYIFVLVFLVSQNKWVLSLYLFYEGNSAAVALAYLLPPMLLFIVAQKYLLNIPVGTRV